MKRFLKRYLPISFIFTFAIFIISYGLLLLASRNSAFADSISGGVGAFLRRGFAYITNPLPLSLAELLVILLVIFCVLLVFWSIFKLRGAAARIRLLFHILSFVFCMYSWYAIAFGASYHTEKIENKMGFEVESVSEGDLLELALYLIDELNVLSEEISTEDGVSKMGYDLCELSEKAVSAYAEFIADYPIFENFNTYAKPVMLSRLMAYGGILGMYTYFTGEANISLVYPDYCIPATVMHEFAHQRAVAREDEANFIAYTVCTYSEDAYIRYSGYLNLFEYTVSAIAKTNRELVGELYSSVSPLVISDMRAYSDFYNEHKVSFIRDISSFFNDTYLKLNGTAGRVSYSEVVRLSVSYYKSLGVISD